jgi:hypothetical protein
MNLNLHAHRTRSSRAPRRRAILNRLHARPAPMRSCVTRAAGDGHEWAGGRATLTRADRPADVRRYQPAGQHTHARTQTHDSCARAAGSRAPLELQPNWNKCNSSQPCTQIYKARRTDSRRPLTLAGEHPLTSSTRLQSDLAARIVFHLGPSGRLQRRRHLTTSRRRLATPTTGHDLGRARAACRRPSTSVDGRPRPSALREVAGRLLAFRRRAAARRQVMRALACK